VQIIEFLGADVSGRGAFFYVWGHLYGSKFIFSGGNLKNNGGKCVSGI